MQYVALFEKDKHGFSVIFPDFPACVTCGGSLDEAVDMAHEALAMFVEEMLEQGRVLPEATPKKQLLELAENKGKKIAFCVFFLEFLHDQRIVLYESLPMNPF